MGTETEDVDVLTQIVSALKKLPKEDQQRILSSVATFLDVGFSSATHRRAEESSRNSSPTATVQPIYSEDRSASAKAFLRDKAPVTDIERVACLAYYLTHYKDTPHFKTLDISTLNTEAAQPKFSSASVAVDNATKAGLLATAAKGNKQISGAGEHYVQLLPDRDAARASIQSVRARRRSKKPTKKKPDSAKLT